MTDDGLALFKIIFVLILMTILVLFLGCFVGQTSALSYATDTLCKQIKTEKNEYLACKQKHFSEVIKEIKVGAK